MADKAPATKIVKGKGREAAVDITIATALSIIAAA